MSLKTATDTDRWLNFLDLDAIADPADKLGECKFFFDLVTKESDKNKFRWLISAFFGSAYSYFEISAIRAYQSFHDPHTGDPIQNDEALRALSRYVRVSKNKKRPTYIKTSGEHAITRQLYELRKGNTHHYPLSIVETGRSGSEVFYFGSLHGEGIHALDFCRQVISLIYEVESELQKHL